MIEHDVLTRLSGEIRKRKKKLSKEVYNTSQRISLAEAEYIFEEGMDQLIIGTGQVGMVTLSNEAFEYFTEKKIRFNLPPHPGRHSTLEQGKRRGCRAVACHLLRCDSHL